MEIPSKPSKTEESKVKLKRRVILLGKPQKKRRKPVAHFLHAVFKEQGPPQSGECSLLRWFWSFHRRVGPWQPEGATIVVCATASLAFHWLRQLLHER